MERATGTEVYGCGSPQTTDITLNIQTTTGGNFSISLNGKNTIEHLKKLVSKKLKVAKDRICLLHRERQLRDGTLEENGLLDGARVILLPSVETGLLSQRPENSVMQALESLNETQVNDFLSGKSPLNLTMRLGDHMMLIQLQLSTLNSSSNSSSRSLRTSTSAKASTSSPAKQTTKKETSESNNSQTTPDKTAVSSSETSSDNCTDKKKQENQPRLLQKKDFEMIKNAFDIYRSMAESKFCEKSHSSNDKEEPMETTSCPISDLSDNSVDTEQSPIKSLSNLVSSPLDPTTSEAESIANTVRSSLMDLLTKNKVCHEEKTPTKASQVSTPQSMSSPHNIENEVLVHTPDSSMSDDSDNFTDQSSFLTESTIDEYPMENLFNSAVDKGLFEEQDESVMGREISNLATMSHGTQESTTSTTLPPFQSINEPLKTKRFQYLLHKTSKFKHPISQSKQKAFMQSVVNKHKKRMQIKQDSNITQPSTSRTEPYITSSRKLILQPSNSAPSEDIAVPSTSKQTFRTPVTPKKSNCASPTPQVDTKDLLEASKNLTQKLKKLSKEVLTNKIDLRSAEESMRSKIGPGAVIESMKHHGKGIYSGTFSGTLNPALQDRYGRPKRDISTIIHILNDLLCATPPITLAQKETKHTCAATDDANKCLGCSQPSCSYGQCDGHLPSTSCSDATTDSTTGAKCRCPTESCPNCPTESTNGEMCKKCDTAKTLAMDNSKTKCKLEQLRLVMQQKKQRREARKLKTLPYTSPPKIGSPEPQAAIEGIETLA